MRWSRAVAAAVLLAASASAETGTSVAQLEALRGIDARLATIAYRLTTANAALCRDLQPATGVAIHTIDQYGLASRANARAAFGFAAPVAIEVVVPNGPAARAGVAQDDSLTAIDGMPLHPEAIATTPTAAARDAVLATIAKALPATPMRWMLLHGGATRSVTVQPVPACRSDFEVVLGTGMPASADGRVVQVGVRYFERYTDEQVAVVVAHELSHDILRHRVRLNDAKVSRGLFAEVGRNGRLFRETEDQADRLGAVLLRNAGYDPQAAVRFWREHGGDVDGGLFRSRTHPASSARARSIAAELAAIPANAPTPYIPPLIAEADAPLR